MATTDQQNIETERRGIADRLFLEHPRLLGMSWFSHGAGAFKIGIELIGAGCAAIIHAAVPGWFTETAGRTVTRIYDHIHRRESGSDNSQDRPDYEI
ncbi:MAG TPA: DUF6356 family protein [Sphingomicrobium sp.]|nr:DUF6356 family protein [Sphingomicrobium sp.]